MLPLVFASDQLQGILARGRDRGTPWVGVARAAGGVFSERIWALAWPTHAQQQAGADAQERASGAFWNSISWCRGFSG